MEEQKGKMMLYKKKTDSEKRAILEMVRALYLVDLLDENLNQNKEIIYQKLCNYLGYEKNVIEGSI